MAKPHKITKLFAWICEDATGEDGIPAVHTADGAMPMVGSDRARIESFRPQAVVVATTLGYPLRLVEFSTVTVLETLPGSATPPRHF